MTACVAQEPRRTEQPTTSHWQKYLPLLLILLGGAVYANSFSGVFLLDDHHTIVSNQAIRSLWPPWVYLGKTRPLVYFTLAVNYAWSGLKVWSYHLVNVAIHLLAGLTLFGLLKRTLLFPRSRFCACPKYLFQLSGRIRRARGGRRGGQVLFKGTPA